MLTIALSKGRLAEETEVILERAGIDCSPLKNIGRKLVLKTADGMLEYILVKPSDVATYVERGVADLGVCGKDVLLETCADVYEMCDLNIGKCAMCVAGFDMPKKGKKPIVATKFSHIAAEYYAARGEDCDLIHLNGSVELAPIVGLSDVIIDLVQTGDTLKQNGLRILETIFQVSARLIANRVTLKIKREQMLPIISAIRGAVEAK